MLFEPRATSRANRGAVASILFLLATSQALASPTIVPFEIVNRKVFLKVSVDGSRPLSFVLDTGAPFAILDLGRARELGVVMGAEVRAGGGGPRPATGARVERAAYTIPGLPGFTQPVRLALPLEDLAPRLGHDFDGILGAEFIGRFVVELDYRERLMRLHDRDTFVYEGPGESIPIRLSRGHPILEAEVTPVGRPPIKGDFVLDIGAGGALALYSPFVAEHRLLSPGLPTVEAIGVRGAGGALAGRVGRVAALRIGGFTLSGPTAHFSLDQAGAFATTAIQGNIGHEIASRFRLFLDYGNERIVFEPAANFTESFDRPQTGLVIEAEGVDYRTFRVTDVLDDSPGFEAGVRPGDVIAAIEGRAAAGWTLTSVLEHLERPVPCTLTIRRGQQTLDVSLSPRPLV